MTAMFRPQIAITKAIGWGEVLGFGHGDDPFWAEVRAAQLASVSRYVPFNVVCIVVNIAALGVVLRDIGEPGFVAAFGVSLVGLLGLWLAGWDHRRRRTHPTSGRATPKLGWLSPKSSPSASGGRC